MKVKIHTHHSAFLEKPNLKPGAEAKAKAHSARAPCCLSPTATVAFEFSPQIATLGHPMLAASLLALRFLLVGATAAGMGTGTVGVSGGGQLWCVAKNNAEDGALQSAIDWACSVDGGRADCAAIQQGGACYDPPDLQQHASYAFNDYFLRSGGAGSPAACDFSGAAALTALNPSKNPE